MATQFPTLIEFIDDFGLAELHKTHDSYNEECDEISFDDFVKQHYEACKEMWYEDMNSTRLLSVPFDNDNDICLESAKLTIVEMINKSLKEHQPMRIIQNEELSCDWSCCPSIIYELNNRVLPAIEKALNRLES